MSTTPPTFDLSVHGITVTTVHHNLPPSALYEHAILFEKATITENGALIAYATVYPLTTLLRILSAQVLAIVLFR
jgi:ATP-dependent phosphoenolpyruvate carboxykinase